MGRKKNRKKNRYQRSTKRKVLKYMELTNVSRIDALKAICTHRDHEGEKLLKNDDESVTCQICGTTFHPYQSTEQEVEKLFDEVVNYLENAKYILGYNPENNDLDELMKWISQSICICKNIPDLYSIALDHFNKYSIKSCIDNSYDKFQLYSYLMMHDVYGSRYTNMGYTDTLLYPHPQEGICKSLFDDI